MTKRLENSNDDRELDFVEIERQARALQAQVLVGGVRTLARNVAALLRRAPADRPA